MTDIYEEFSRKTKHIGAHALVLNGKFVGKVVFSYPRDGAGRLHVYLHVFGYSPVKGHAGGYGYDKALAAVKRACTELNTITQPAMNCAALEKVKRAIKSESYCWQDQFKDAGFEIFTIT